MSFLDQINPISIAEFEKYASGSVSNTNIKISTHTFRGDISQLIQAEVFIPIVSALQFTFDLCPYSFLTFLFSVSKKLFPSHPSRSLVSTLHYLFIGGGVISLNCFAHAEAKSNPLYAPGYSV